MAESRTAIRQTAVPSTVTGTDSNVIKINILEVSLPDPSWFALRDARVKHDTKEKSSNLFNATTYAPDEGARLDVVAAFVLTRALPLGYEYPISRVRSSCT